MRISDSTGKSRALSIALSIAVPFVVQSALNAVVVSFSDRPLYNYVTPVTPVISSFAGFLCLAPRERRLLVGVIYFPLMYVALSYFSALMAIYLFGFDL